MEVQASTGAPGRPAARKATATQLQTRDLVLQAFSEVLGSSAIGPDDDFFDVGGTSLDLLVAISRLSERLNLPLDGTIVLQGPTASALAEAIRAKAASTESREAP